MTSHDGADAQPGSPTGLGDDDSAKEPDDVSQPRHGSPGSSGGPGDHDGANGREGAVEPPEGSPSGPGGRVWTAALRLREKATSTSPTSRRWLMAVALVIFVLAAVLAIRNFPETDGPIGWHFLLLGTLVGAPLAVVLNALEYRAAAQSVGRHVDLLPALRVTVLGSAANMLPLPGSVLVRMQAMTAMGTTVRAAASASLMTGLVWIGATLTLAGAAQVVVGGLAVGAAVTAVGLVVTGAGLAMLRRRGSAVFRSVAPALVTIEVLFVLVAGMRLFFILRGLGIDVGASDALGLTVAAAVATAAGVFPAGLGLREALTGGISPLVGLPAAAGIAAAVVDRIARMLLLAVLAAVFMVTTRGRRPAASPDERTDAGVVTAAHQAPPV